MSLCATRNLVRPAGARFVVARRVSAAEQHLHRPRSRCWKSSSSTTGSASPTAAATTTTAGNKSKVVLEAERQAYLRTANEQMKRYHDTRELMRQGKLPSKNAHRGPQHAGKAQAAVAGVFLVLFIAMPFLGRKIARDDDFREKWIPKWYDYTVQKPENPWTREELHEQMLRVQMQLRERAIKGDFAPEKLEQLQSSMQKPPQQQPVADNGGAAAAASKIPKAWDTFQPALGKEDDYNEN